MSYLDLHKKKIGLLGHNCYSRNEQIDNSKDFLNVTFSQSPLYEIVKIENKEYEVRIWEDKIQKNGNFYEQKELIFRPDTFVENGSYVVLINPVTKLEEIWLILYYKADILTPKAFIRKCTKFLNYNGEKYPCVVSTNISSSMEVEKNQELVLPKGHLLVYVKSTEDTMNIKENTRFLIDDNAYSVQTIENTINTENGIGIVTLTMKKVPVNFEEKQEIGETIKEEVLIENNEIINKNDFWGDW